MAKAVETTGVPGNWCASRWKGVHLTKPPSFQGVCIFGREIMQKRDQIVEKLKELSDDSKITCTDARKLAEDLQVEPIEVGKLCDEMKIKIIGCELGCF
jgi:hypothetical protein